MRHNELSKQTQTAIKVNTKKQTFVTGNWELSGKSISNMALPKEVLSGAEDSFFYNSQILGAMLNEIGSDYLTVKDLTNLVMASSAIENADTRAATFLRDTAGGKPIDKVQKQENKLSDITDAELEYILSKAEVVEVEPDE